MIKNNERRRSEEERLSCKNEIDADRNQSTLMQKRLRGRLPREVAWPNTGPY